MVFSTYAIFHGTDVFQRSRFLQVGEWHPLSRRFLLVSAILLVLPFMASFFFQYQRISDIGYLIAIADRSNLGSGSGYQLMALPWLSLFTYLLFMEKLRARKCRENKLQYSLPAIAVLAIISSIAGFIIGSRSQGLIPFFILMLLYYAASEAGRFRLRPKHLTIVALILAILVSGSALQSVRDQVMGSEAAPEMIEVGVSDIYEGAVGYLGTAENMFG